MFNFERVDAEHYGNEISSQKSKTMEKVLRFFQRR
jgi:hypothetical protein